MDIDEIKQREVVARLKDRKLELIELRAMASLENGEDPHAVFAQLATETEELWKDNIDHASPRFPELVDLRQYVKDNMLINEDDMSTEDLAILKEFETAPTPAEIAEIDSAKAYDGDADGEVRVMNKLKFSKEQYWMISILSKMKKIANK